MSISSGNGLVPNRQQAITWTNADPVHRRIYAALGVDELMVMQHSIMAIDLVHFMEWLVAWQQQTIAWTYIITEAQGHFAGKATYINPWNEFCIAWLNYRPIF